jgi:hypothetical protein
LQEVVLARAAVPIAAATINRTSDSKGADEFFGCIPVVVNVKGSQHACASNTNLADLVSPSGKAPVEGHPSPS